MLGTRLETTTDTMSYIKIAEDAETTTYRPMRQTVYNRYQACCVCCGSLEYYAKKVDAVAHAEKHDCKKTSVVDRMAHKNKNLIVWERPA